MNGPKITQVQKTVARYYGMSAAEMLSGERDWMFSHPRQVAMFLARELSGHSTTVIGHWFHRHHTTVIHAIRSVEKRAHASAPLRRDIARLREKLDQ